MQVPSIATKRASEYYSAARNGDFVRDDTERQIIITLSISETILTIQELSNRICVNVRTLERKVLALVRAGFIRRVADDDDMRRVRFRLSEEGMNEAAVISKYFGCKKER